MYYLKLAKELRTQSTEAEWRLWLNLSRRQMGGYKFRRQHPLGPYIVDFICLEAKLIIELDGGQHSEQTAEDNKRSEWLSSQGFHVLRFWNFEIFNHLLSVLESIANHLGIDRSPPPYPPPCRGRQTKQRALQDKEENQTNQNISQDNQGKQTHRILLQNSVETQNNSKIQTNTKIQNDLKKQNSTKI